MTKLLTLFMILTLSSFTNEFIKDFDNKINEAYGEYKVFEEYSNSYYTIKVIYGVLDNEVRYGIGFVSEVPNEYILKVNYNNKIYNLDTNTRGDIIIIGLNLNSGDNFSLEIYNKDGKLQHINKFQDIKIITKDEFYSLDQRINGLDKGGVLTKLKTSYNFDFQKTLYVIFAFVIVICGLIILFFYKKHRGMFNDDVKSANVFNFKEFLNSTFESYNDVEELKIEDKKDIIENELDESDKKVENNYRTHYYWKHDEEEKSGFDIKQHLINEGYVSDYRLASNDEKNQIMLELIKLRDKRIITNDDYLEETSKLWKN